jgi:hypothetical protein
VAHREVQEDRAHQARRVLHLVEEEDSSNAQKS